jgi:hypothetical protein
MRPQLKWKKTVPAAATAKKEANYFELTDLLKD